MCHRDKSYYKAITLMTKSIRCSDVGVNCDWRAAAPTEGELMVMVESHARAHGYFEIPHELLLKVKSAIRDDVSNHKPDSV